MHTTTAQIGFLEVNAVGWVYGHQDCIKRVGRPATYVYTAGCVPASVLKFLAGWLAGCCCCLIPSLFAGSLLFSTSTCWPSLALLLCLAIADETCPFLASSAAGTTWATSWP